MAMIEVNWRPDRSSLRGFGLICLVAFGAIGGWVIWRHSIFGLDMAASTARTAAGVLAGLAVVCGVLALAAPAALRPLYVALTVVSLPIGFVLSHVIMALLFYGLLTPVGLVFRLLGRDPLHRRFEPAARTYWNRRESVTDVRRYFRQF